MKSDLMAGSAEENIDDHIGSSYQDQVQVPSETKKRKYGRYEGKIQFASQRVKLLASGTGASPQHLAGCSTKKK
ncbi:hypothetical protein FRX31_023955 [Thalictrum thalictroides]|uniref:Uncharacterized protein n=1 Tax=Thalictrum thalictroides TaxID=46969 RepID=A0A7J6VNZ2_THATH|nr:hypothetical protein FRX31_023955 [Thalictrum thalictroides]